MDSRIRLICVALAGLCLCSSALAGEVVFDRCNVALTFSEQNWKLSQRRDERSGEVMLISADGEKWVLVELLPRYSPGVTSWTDSETPEISVRADVKAPTVKGRPSRLNGLPGYECAGELAYSPAGRFAAKYWLTDEWIYSLACVSKSGDPLADGEMRAIWESFRFLARPPTPVARLSLQAKNRIVTIAGSVFLFAGAGLFLLVTLRKRAKATRVRRLGISEGMRRKLRSAATREESLSSGDAPGYAAALAFARYSAERIAKRLVSKGVDQATAARLSEEACQGHRQKTSADGNLHLGVGGLLLLIGLLATIFSYRSAVENGGLYTIWLGAALGGLGEMIWGLVLRRESAALPD